MARIPAKITAVTMQPGQADPYCLYLASVELGAMQSGDVAVIENWADQMAPLTPHGALFICDALLRGGAADNVTFDDEALLFTIVPEPPAIEAGTHITLTFRGRCFPRAA